MASQTDVKVAMCAASATTTVSASRTRLKGLSISASVGATVTVLDGTTTLFAYPAMAGASSVQIPGEGVLCTTSLIVTCAVGATVLAFYG